MTRILPGIASLEQHLHHLGQQPEMYRPARCPHCGMARVWRHGHYLRKADREGQGGIYSDPVPVPRYYCPHCRRSSSRLPSCMAPHRWYLWVVQQAVLTALLGGASFRKASGQCRPGRRTISRWWQRIKERFALHSFHLRGRFPELGRHASISSFWSACLEQMALADAMAWLDQDGVVIP